MNIYNKLEKMDIKNTQLKTLCPTINKLPINHAEIIYMLIIHYNFLESKSISSNIPYNGKTTPSGKGVIFVIEHFPLKLQKIISNYIYLISM